MKKSKAGIDGIGFELILDAKSAGRNLTDRLLVTPDGNEYGKIEFKDGKARAYLCLPRFIRSDNVIPFGLADTLPALESILAIACDEKHRERLKACQFIINKAYGESTAFLADDLGNEPLTINIVRSSKKVEDEDDDWN